jgi:HEAT repeat protein
MLTDKEKLIIQLKSEELENRLYAAEDLLELLDEVVVNELINALAIERSQIVKEALVTALVESLKNEEILTDTIYNKLFNFFKIEDEYLRNQTITILGSGKNGVVQFLKSNYQASDKDIRKLILDTLLLINSIESIDVLRLGLNDEDINNQITAIEYLTILKDNQLVNHLKSILKEKSTLELMLVQVVESALQILK